MNSGIVRAEEHENHYLFYGATESVYKCNKMSYCLRINNEHIWTQLKELHGDQVGMMNEDTDWSEIDWIIGE